MKYNLKKIARYLSASVTALWIAVFLLYKITYITHDTQSSNNDRILCIILTSPKTKMNMMAVKSTWSKRCYDSLFILAGKSDVPSREDSILYVNTTENRNHLTDKIMLTLRHIHKYYANSFDWILKADDDTYVIVENLRLLLSKYNPMQPGYIGYHMKPIVRNGYMSGGAGYVISQAAFQKLANKCFQTTPCKNLDKNEDAAVGLLLQSANIPVLSSLDRHGRETFHPESLEKHLIGPFPHWLDGYGWNKVKYGEDCCSEYSVSFHHLSHTQIYLYEHLLYKTSVHGRIWSLDKLTVNFSRAGKTIIINMDKAKGCKIFYQNCTCTVCESLLSKFLIHALKSLHTLHH